MRRRRADGRIRRRGPHPRRRLGQRPDVYKRQPQGRITDHRINYTIYNLSAFMDGDIQAVIDHLIVAENAERLKESEL